jgi:hypothetical protein
MPKKRLSKVGDQHAPSKAGDHIASKVGDLMEIGSSSMLAGDGSSVPTGDDSSVAVGVGTTKTTFSISVVPPVLVKHGHPPPCTICLPSRMRPIRRLLCQSLLLWLLELGWLRRHLELVGLRFRGIAAGGMGLAQQRLAGREASSGRVEGNGGGMGFRGK